MRSLTARLLGRLRGLYSFDREGCRVRLSIRQRLPFTAFAVVLLWFLARPSPVAMMSMVALGGVILLAYLWARAMAQWVSGERRLQYAAVQVGDELEEQVLLRNTTFLPVLWAEFSDHSSLPGYSVTSVRAADEHSSIDWRAHATCSQRGLFSLGPWELTLGDPFGIFRVHQTYLQKNEILVYPPLAPLPERLLPRGQVQGEERPLRQPLRAETTDAFTARPYQSGDPLRHIHWPITARHEALYVKVFDPEATSTVWLVADLEASVHYGQGTDSSLETMILLLASLSSELLRRRVAVGFLAHSGRGQHPAPPGSDSSPLDGLAAIAARIARIGRPTAPPAPEGLPEVVDESVPVVVLPDRSPLHQWDLLRALAALQPAPGSPFRRTLAQARSLVSGRDQVLAVTPSLQPDWLGELHQLNRGRRGQAGAGVILLDPASFGGPYLPAAVETFVGVLAEQGVRASVVRQGELRPISGSYGEVSRWEFQTLGTGRVFVRHAPRRAKFNIKKDKAGGEG